MKECDARNFNNVKLIFRIVLLSLLCICISIILIGCLCSCYRKYREKQISPSEVLGINTDPMKIEWVNESQINHKVGKDIVWSSKSKPSQALRVTGQPCTICLEDDTVA